VKATSSDTPFGNGHEISGVLSYCEACAARDEGVCGALSGHRIDKLSRIAHRRGFAAGQMILAEGAPAEFFGAIIGGVVKLTKTLADGRQHIVGLLFPSDFLGRAFRNENKYYAEAATDVDLCCFPRPAFEKLLSECPPVGDCLLRLTLNELDACQEWMLLLGRKSAEERVASFLMMIARRAAMPAPDGSVQFELPLARSDIADCLGLTIETVSRQITRLKSRRIIGLVSNREIFIPDAARLEEAANGRPHTSFD
jgi:CRP/FNR family transcriptional regulator